MLNVMNSLEKLSKCGRKPCNVGGHGRCIGTTSRSDRSKREAKRKVRRLAKAYLRSV